MDGTLVDGGREWVRDVSKHLLGNKHRLDVLTAVAISTEGVIYPAELARPLRLADNAVGPVLKHAADGERLLEVPDKQHKYYQRLESVFWPFVTALLAETIEQYAVDRDQDARTAIVDYWQEVFETQPAEELLSSETRK